MVLPLDFIGLLYTGFIRGFFMPSTPLLGVSRPASIVYTYFLRLSLTVVLGELFPCIAVT